MKDLERYAQASIGQDGYRYTVRGNADVPGCVDLMVEEWSSADRRWNERACFECVRVDMLEWLVKQAKVVVRIEEDEDKDEGGR